MNILNKLRIFNSLKNALARQIDTLLVLARDRIVAILPVSAAKTNKNPSFKAL